MKSDMNKFIERKDDIEILVTTKDQARIVCKFMKRLGWTWEHGTSYNNTYWSECISRVYYDNHGGAHTVPHSLSKTTISFQEFIEFLIFSKHKNFLTFKEKEEYTNFINS